PALRARFTGQADHVVNFFHFIAEQVRELMAALGFRTIDELVGRADLLDVQPALEHWKARGLDLSRVLDTAHVFVAEGATPPTLRRTMAQGVSLAGVLDAELIALAEPALARREPVRADLTIQNVNRAVGTMLGSEVSRRFGAEGLPENSIDLTFHGSAGQSFGAFVPAGITLRLEGDANDYVGKGLSGGRLIVRPVPEATFEAERNVIAGNVVLYGATAGEAFLRGVVGERFAVRNSGAVAVVEGVGDHGCEYMTGGRVVVLGRTGRNFAAGMSGGIAYVFDADGDFSQRCNLEMVLLEALDGEDERLVRTLIARHRELTGSVLAARLLEQWPTTMTRLLRVMPIDYKKALEAQRAELQKVAV
ncbi:MAG: glutamate synthase subunit alpha, partial [Luteitalea sp.]